MVSISEKLNLKPQLSGADVKSLYEAEADTNAYTDAEKTSVSTALQPDQEETISGNYTFNGALILPNNSRINGVEHFYQTTKPTVRGDSSALVAGDRWWKTDDGTEWFWNGTYWLSPLKDSSLLLTGSVFNGNNLFYMSAIGEVTDFLLIEKITHNFRYEAATSPGGAIDSTTNYWTIAPWWDNTQNSYKIDEQGVTRTQYEVVRLESLLGVVYSVPSNFKGFGTVWSRVGTVPSLTSLSSSVNYRLIYS